jgi:phage tail-like protein
MDFDAKLLEQAHPAFRFVVTIGGRPVAAFTECTLPTIEWETEELREGGLNTYTHLLPGQRKSARLTLKSGVGKSEMLDWYFDALAEKFVPKTVTVQLLDAQLRRIITWEIQDAFPIRWAGPQLQSGDSAIAIQTLELACGEITVTT